MAKGDSQGLRPALSAASGAPPAAMQHASGPATSGAHLSGQGSCRGTGAALLSFWAPRGGRGVAAESKHTSGLTLP